MDSANIRSNTIFIAKESVANPQPQLSELRQKADENNQSLIVADQATTEKLISGNQDVFQQADSFKQQNLLDNSINFRVRRELDVYQAIDKQTQREDISKLLGVDIFA